MVKEIVNTVFICEGCNKSYSTAFDAVDCEKVHTEGIIKKVYLHGDYNVSEYMEVYHLSKEDAINLQSALSEVDLLVRIKGKNIFIIGIDGTYTKSGKDYEEGDFYGDEYD